MLRKKSEEQPHAQLSQNVFMNKPKKEKDLYNKNIKRETTENIYMSVKLSVLIDRRKN